MQYEENDGLPFATEIGGKYKSHGGESYHIT